MPNKTKIKSMEREAIELLKKLIRLPSFSGEENKTADTLQVFMENNGIQTSRYLNNVWATNKYFNSDLPTILLNSHHDTVKPNATYSRDPFLPEIIDGKLYGLGSNDAGGALVSLLTTFRYYYENKKLKYNLIYAATAEEEISGKNGISSVYHTFPPIDFAIVGEPTLMDLAIVLDCISYGKSGHAAREEGDNAIYKAIRDVEWFRTFSFPKVSETLGPIKMSVTIINAGQQHNVVPSICKFTVDVRTTDAYTNEETLQIIQQHVQCEIHPQPDGLRPSAIQIQHPFVQAGIKAGRKTYVSPTTSDQALIPCTSLKVGPGDSARSHIADEFIYLSEIENGIELYITMLAAIIKTDFK